VSNSDSYIIKNISGLDSDDISPAFFADNSSGLNYYNVSMPERTVTMLIGLNPQYSSNETANSLRNNLYKMVSFTRNSLIELRFMENATHISSLFGFVTKFESSLFTTNSDVQITFRCDQPLFLAPQAVTLTSPTAGQLFVGSDISTYSWTDNLSTAAHGFKMQILFPSTITSLTIESIPDYNKATFSANIAVSTANSVLYFSSEKNNKYFYIELPNGTIVEKAHTIVSGSIWPMMYPGNSYISIDTSRATNNYVLQSLSYTPTYWGV
jgi:hypothetical protein